MIVKKLFGTITGKKICILGFAFKANTNDTRESAAISICKDLLDEGAFLSIHDPKVSSKQIEIDLNSAPLSTSTDSLEILNLNIVESSWYFADNIIDSIQGADAIVVLTEWPEYSSLDWGKIARSVRNPCCVFDARSILKKEDVIKSGLNFWKIGDGSKSKK